MSQISRWCIYFCVKFFGVLHLCLCTDLPEPLPFRPNADVIPELQFSINEVKLTQIYHVDRVVFLRNRERGKWNRKYAFRFPLGLSRPGDLQQLKTSPRLLFVFNMVYILKMQLNIELFFNSYFSFTSKHITISEALALLQGTQLFTKLTNLTHFSRVFKCLWKHCGEPS